MGKTLAVLTCFLSACIFVNGCSRATPTPPQPAPGVLVIDAADNPTSGQKARSYRIGNSTIPGGDFEALKRAIIAARKGMPQQDPNQPRLIIKADARVAAKAIAPVVLTAIRCGFEPVDLDGNLPALVPWTQVTDQPPPDPILVRVLTSFDGTISYELTGVGPAIVSERELRELLKVKREKSTPDTPILIEPMGQTKDEFTLTAYTQAVHAGFVRFIPWPGPLTSPSNWHPPSNQPAKMKLFDVPIEAHHIVYISDCSGSMITSFQRVQFELTRSISRLRPDQDFTILIMAEDRSRELDPNGLRRAKMENKLKAVRFLKVITPLGTTNLLPSLTRAFEVLASADKSKPGEVIFILTDGDFAGLSGGGVYTATDGRKLCGNDAVIQYLRDHNADKAVQVNTILLYNKEDYAVKVHKQIAAENGGQFRFVSEDE